jgi:phosphonopyruvate decarboxylase
MIDPQEFFGILLNEGIEFYTGVPDSLLKPFNSCVSDNIIPSKNIIAANEGAALSLATGYHLATGKTPLVYLQNSGLGNLINPLLSLVDKKVYSIPILIVIGWRGQPEVKDEPQHVKQGKVTLDLLEAMDMPYKVLRNSTPENLKVEMKNILTIIKESSSPYFLVVPKDIFLDYKMRKSVKSIYKLKREEAIKIIVNQLSNSDMIVSTTGKTSRELFEYRQELQQSHDNDFLTVGSMGHANQIALGIALSKPDRNIYCFDGDGAVLMHMGSIPIIGDLAPENFIHIIFNNGSHESVGGQPTVGYNTNFQQIALASGYKQVRKVITKQEIESAISEVKNSKGPILIEILINQGARENLGRPTIPTLENKKNFMNKLRKR